MSSATPPWFFDKCFWCLVTAIGQLTARLVRPYQTLPLCLARLVDEDVSMDARRVIAHWFVNTCGDCCLDAAFSKLLHSKCSGADDLLPDGSLHGVLQLAFCGKNTNIEAENNFARAQKAAQARTSLSTSMAAKHVLSEAKRCHLSDITSRVPASVATVDDESGGTS
ncbi:unnamed protein product [Symbiodinium sp. CCMP2592]|nr:unnamed protein product [Symbiodinium sp. CCMP2592]